MTPEKWARAKAVFETAIETSGPERLRYVEQACAGDAELADTIHRLLHRHDESDGFLDAPAMLEEEAEELGHVAGATFRAGDLINERFRIGRVVGRGGMGEVYEALDLELNETVALKAIRLESSEIPQFAERFKEEVSRSRRVVSRHVCRVHDLFIHQDGNRRVLFLTMEFLDGTPLSRHLEDHAPLPPEEAREILRQVAAGLGEVHAAGILHLDLKPSNIMLCGTRVVIMDFGLAKQEGTSAEGLIYGGSIGTPSYMAPEQILRDRVTAATDIFALGLTAFEMVTGRKPLPDAADWAGAAARLEAIPPPASPLNPLLNPRWDAAFVQGLARQPEDRFPTAEAFVAALEDPAPAPPPPPRRRVLGMAAAGIAAAAAAGVYVFNRRHSALTIALTLDDSGSSNLMHVSAGFTDRLRTRLLRNPSIFVATAQKPGALSGAQLAQLGHQLNTQYAISVKGIDAGGRVELLVRAVDTATAKVVAEWTGSASAGEIDALSTLAANRLLTQLGVPPAESTLASGATPVLNAAAYERYLLGLFHLNRRTDDSLLRAKGYLHDALAADSEFGRAYSALAVADAVIAERNLVPPQACLIEAKTAAARATELDPGDPVAHAAMGQVISLLDRSLARAEFAFRRSLELDPHSVQAHQWISYLMQKERRFAPALQHANEAIRLEPLSVPAHRNLGILYQYSRDDRRLLDAFRQVLELDPRDGIAHSIMALAVARTGRRSEAIDLFEKSNRRKLHPHRLRSWVELNVILGDRQEAERTAHQLADLKRDTPSTPSSYLAMAFATLGHTDEAYQWIETAFDEYDGFLSMIHAHPAYDPIRKDPRYPSVLDRLGIRTSA